MFIKKWLDENHITYCQQQRFKNCKHKQLLAFDFYLPNNKTLLEYNGKQHYTPVKWFGGDKKFEQVQKRDQIKRNFAKDNNYILLEIPYTLSNEEVINLLESNLKSKDIIKCVKN